MNVPKINFTTLRPPVLMEPFRYIEMKAQQPVVLKQPPLLQPFEFPSMVYGPSITSATGATINKSSQVLEESQIVSADQRFVTQLWS